ncbi:MAG: hypothetical protein WCW77_00665 [Patescibacteria group bacterium]|jgi:hypothetical protein
MYQVEKKYNKTKTNWYNGNVYHSCKEAGHARVLDRKLEKGEIKDWERQFKIDFFIEQQEGADNHGYLGKIPVLVANPEDRRSASFLCRYYMDFVVYHHDGIIEFVEVKGLVGMDWKMKWTMLESVFGDNPGYKLTIVR